MRSLPCLLPALLATMLSAQTYVVDVNGGAGSAFTSIAAAVAAVPDGATLVVRSGTYGTFNILGKGLTILGQPGVVISGSNPGLVNLGSQNQNQRVVLRSLRFQDVWLTLLACQGTVQIEDCAPSSSNRLLGLTVDQCRQVHVSRSVFDDNLAGIAGSFTTSAVVCVDTTFTTRSANPGVRCSSGRTQLVRCTILGGSGATGSGIELLNGNLRLLGGSAGSRTSSVPSISGNGSLRVNWNTVAVSGGPVAAGVAVVAVADSATSASAASVGGSAIGSLLGSSGHAGALLFGLPAPAQVMTGFAEELWLALPSVQMVAIGTVTGFTPVTLTVAVPANPVLRGTTFGWQGVTQDPARGFVLSNPAWFTLL